MTSFKQGFLGTQQAGVEAVNDITVAVRAWFANRTPLVCRLPFVPLERVDFEMYTHQYRARSTTLTAAVTSGGQTTLAVADSSSWNSGDVLQVTDSSTGRQEVLQSNGVPPSATSVVVVRGVSGTSPLSTIANGSTVQLIGNSSSGSGVDQTGLTSIGTLRTGYAQTFQFPVQVGGSAQSTRAAILPNGMTSPFDFNRTFQLQAMVDDIEKLCYYGIAQAPVDASGVTAKMAGLKSILTTNNTTSPTNASAYGGVDLVRDLFTTARSGGGEPDMLFVSTNFLTGFAIWGQAVQRIPAGATSFGTPINTFAAPFLPRVQIIEAPLLRPFTAFALTSNEVYIRNKRNPFWNQRADRGDAVEGEWLAELGLEVRSQEHHAWVDGIQAFASGARLF